MIPLPSSARWNQTFSSMMISPPVDPIQAFSISGPTQSERNRILVFKRSSRQATVGFIEYYSSLCPSGLPRWLIKIIDFAPFFLRKSIVGRVETILVGSLIFPSLIGTLKSTLIRTHLSFIKCGIQSIVSFLDNILDINVILAKKFFNLTQNNYKTSDLTRKGERI